MKASFMAPTARPSANKRLLLCVLRGYVWYCFSGSYSVGSPITKRRYGRAFFVGLSPEAMRQTEAYRERVIAIAEAPPEANSAFRAGGGPTQFVRY